MEIKNYIVSRFATNCYLVSDDTKHAFIVDPGDVCNELIDEIKQEELIPDYIVLTHGHGDHTGGIDFVKEAFPDIKLIASRSEAEFLYDRSMSMGKGGIIPDIEVRDGDIINVGNMTLKVIFTPGHTPGGICLYSESDNVLFSGDTLFHCSIGRTDFPGGSTSDIFKSIKDKLLLLPDDTKVLPGHDAPTTIGYEKRYNPWL